jgi:hypothetical protein
MTEKELEQFAEENSKTIVIRSYHEGNSNDCRRETTEREKEIIKNILFGAVLTINGNGDKQTVMDTAEYIGNLFLPEMNGYETIYNVLRNFNNGGIINE